MLLENKNLVKTWSSPNSASEVLSDTIKKLLTQHKKKFQDLKKIAVVTGPGHFSRLRTGITTANALAYALQVPVVGLSLQNNIPKFEELNSKKGTPQALPMYGKEPNISKPKNKALRI